MTSQTPDIQAVLERLDKLERQNRTMSRAGLGILAGLGFLVLMGQAAPKSRVLEAEKFVIKDASGTVRGEFGVDKEAASLTLINKNGIRGVAMSVGETYTRLTLSDSSGKVRLGLGGAKDQFFGAVIDGDVAATSFFVRDNKGQLRAKLNMVGDDPELSFFDSNGAKRVRMGITGDYPGLSLFDTNRKSRVALSLIEGGSGLTMFDANENVRAGLLSLPRGVSFQIGDGNIVNGAMVSMNLFPDNGPSLIVRDGQGFESVLGVSSTVTTTTGESHQSSAAALTLFNKDGKVIWKEP